MTAQTKAAYLPSDELSDDDKERELTNRGIVVGAFVRDPQDREGLVTEVGREVKPHFRPWTSRRTST
jgi:hypothetical protein